MELVVQIFQICIVPILGVLTKYIIDILTIKREHLKQQMKSDFGKKCVDNACSVAEKCIAATKQTYVDALKDANVFDEEAQKKAFKKTYESTMALLDAETKKYLEETTGDLESYLTTIIEAKIKGA